MEYIIEIRNWVDKVWDVWEKDSKIVKRKVNKREGNGNVK